MSALSLFMIGANAQTNQLQSKGAQQSTDNGMRKNGKPMPSPSEKASRMVKKMDMEVKLNDDQKKSIISLATDHFTEMEKIKMSANGDNQKIKEVGKTSRMNFNQGIKKVLTPEQFKLWETNKREQAQKRKDLKQDQNELQD